MKIPSKEAPVDYKIDWCINEIVEIKKECCKSSPWYTSLGVWFAILCTILLIVLVYVYYLSTIGYTSPYLPEWMIQ